eukprot:TRINITY_DN2870_c0_g1_i1.p1 TRINITY_DN2870_c0_g1~~TRINITY_DN2870_c0_g1_i1.p1  ORF type:complete len:364 (+),score=63.12 TRINITY_DN2870_c0_g1_i1:72-1094(+)
MVRKSAKSNEVDQALLDAVEREHEKWADARKAWDTMHADEEHVFFQTLEIARDGGLEEIGVKGELWYMTRIISAIILLLFVVYNVYYLLLVDVKILLAHGLTTEQQFLLSKTIIEAVGLSITVHNAAAWVASLEIVLLGVLFLVSGYQGYLMTMKIGLKKWSACAALCWEYIPHLSNFSAMKILQFISPSKMSTDLFDILFYRESGKMFHLLMFIICRPVLAVIGIDCFLVKFRLTAGFVLQHDFNLTCFFGAFSFLNQIIGALNLSREMRFRLYRFVFGGEDGVITDEERNIQHVWEAMVSEKIFASYPKWKACALMLTWNDDDFQLLTLNQVNFKIGN